MEAQFRLKPEAEQRGRLSIKNSALFILKPPFPSKSVSLN